jgi:hypothetical protein
MTEVIAACGYETRAAEVDEHSFTKSLTETLAVASKGSPFSVGELHSRVLRKLKCWTPSLLRGGDGSYIDEPDGRLACERQPRRTPIYSIVSESLPRRSIVLAPLPPVAVSSYHESDHSSSLDSVPGSSTPSQSDSSAESCCEKRKRLDQDDGPCAQILLAIRLENVQLNADEWVDWIRNLPEQGKAVHVEGKYESFSTLLLLRMPVAMWNLLPENPAYSFVGFVTSGNKAATQGSLPACGCSNICSTCEPMNEQHGSRPPSETGEEAGRTTPLFEERWASSIESHAKPEAAITEEISNSPQWKVMDKPRRTLGHKLLSKVAKKHTEYVYCWTWACVSFCLFRSGLRC